MSKNLKSFITRMIIFIILMVGITSVTNLYQASVAPTVTDQVALGQMSDTDEGHITMRAYTHTTNNVTPYVVVVAGIVLYFVVVSGSVTRLLKEATKPEIETENK